MADKSVIHGQWSTLIEGLKASPMEMYTKIEEKLEGRKIPDATRSRVSFSEGGVFSAKREYLRVRRKEYVVDICASPFGSGFFFSSWLIEPVGCLGALAEIPILGLFLQIFLGKHTYYHHDTANMFYTAVHQALIEVVDEQTQAVKGLRALSEVERAPTFRTFLK